MSFINSTESPLDRVRRQRDGYAKELAQERREVLAVIDVINLYGDEVLHKALDDAGLLMEGRDPQTQERRP